VNLLISFNIDNLVGSNEQQKETMAKAMCGLLLMRMNKSACGY
jgi:hypothetical protein